MSHPETNPSKRRLLVAYLGHLLVPLLIALDETVFLLKDFNRERPLVDKMVLSLCVAWLVAGLVAFFVNRDWTRFSFRIQKPLISFYTILFMLALLEGFVRILFPLPTTPSIWPPATQWVSHPAVWGVTGVGETTRFTTNEIGLRGPSLPREGKPYKIITVGGSTTECLVLDDSKEWPHLVMEGLTDRQRNMPVWLANAGIGGHTTVHHLMVLKSMPIFKQVDMVILLFGLNDLNASLAYAGGPTQAHLERDTETFRQAMVGSGQSITSFPLYKHLRLYRYAERAKTSLVGRRTSIRGAVGSWDWLEKLRRRRATGKFVPLPDLRVGLDEYRQRVRRIVDQCRTLQVRCLFLTQPVHWRKGLSPEEEASLWTGWIAPLGPVDRLTPAPGAGYVSASDLETAMNAYNRVLLKTCQEEGLECFDLAGTVPKNGTVFYDDDHYTDAGARIVADRLLDYLLANPPFSKGPSTTAVLGKSN